MSYIDGADGVRGTIARIGSISTLISGRIGSLGYLNRLGTQPYLARLGTQPYLARLGTQPYLARLGTQPYLARVGSLGYLQRLGSVGYGQRIGTIGHVGSAPYLARVGSLPRIGTLGYLNRVGTIPYIARVGTQPYLGRIGSVGYQSRLGSVGYQAIGTRATAVYTGTYFWKGTRPSAGKTGTIHLMQGSTFMGSWLNVSRFTSVNFYVKSRRAGSFGLNIGFGTQAARLYADTSVARGLVFPAMTGTLRFTRTGAGTLGTVALPTGVRFVQPVFRAAGVAGSVGTLWVFATMQP